MKRIVLVSVAAGSMVAGLLLAPAVAQEDRAPLPDKPIAAAGAAPAFDSLMLQSSLGATSSLGQLAQETSVTGVKVAAFGFAAKSDEAKTFLIGAMYSESLAYLQGGSPAKAAAKMKTIEQELVAMGAPTGLFNYVTKTRYALQSARYPHDALVDMLSLFQPLFADFAGSRSKDRLVLFRAGSWLADLALVAAAGNAALIHQQPQLEYVAKEMTRLEAPKGVLESLKQIGTLMDKKDLAARDFQQIGNLIRNIQSLLA